MKILRYWLEETRGIPSSLKFPNLRYVNVEMCRLRVHKYGKNFTFKMKTGRLSAKISKTSRIHKSEFAIFFLFISYNKISTIFVHTQTAHFSVHIPQVGKIKTKGFPVYLQANI